jgi:hypothetical protein
MIRSKIKLFENTVTVSHTNMKVSFLFSLLFAIHTCYAAPTPVGERLTLLEESFTRSLNNNQEAFRGILDLITKQSNNIKESTLLHVQVTSKISAKIEDLVSKVKHLEKDLSELRGKVL